MNIVLENSEFQSENTTILIVDDCPNDLKLVVEILEAYGFNIVISKDGESCLIEAKKNNPDIIFLDTLMPEIDGIRTCERLKANPETRDIPVILMIALSNTEDQITGFKVGAVDYITKPIKVDEVLARVKLYIQQQHLTQKLRHKNLLLQAEIKQRIATEAKLKETLEQLQNVQKQIIPQQKLACLGDFTSSFAHELCNPLNFVQNFAQLSLELVDELMEELEQEINSIDAEKFDYIQELITDIKHNTDGIYQHSKRAERIIKTMVQYTEVDGREFEAINLNIILNNSLQLTAQNWKQQNFQIPVNTNYDRSIQKIELVSADIIQAFMNIFDNAYYALKLKLEQQESNNQDFTPILSIKTQNLQEKVEICIYDNGIGIDPVIQGKIFDPFITTKPSGEGIGLGLSLAYKIIVGQHHGNIKVNTELGNYTEFIVEIPVASYNQNSH